MSRYILGRVAWGMLSIFVVSLLTFAVIHVLPGDVALVVLGPDRASDPEAVAAMQRVLGTDKPITAQFLSWAGGALKGDLGVSLTDNRPVTPELLHRLPVTLELALASLLLSVLIGVPLGVTAAIRRGFIERVIEAGVVLGIATPSFFVGIALLLFGSRYMPSIPTLDYVPFSQDPTRNLLLMIYPVISLTLAPIAVAAQTTRSAVSGVMRMQFVTTARAKGLSERSVTYRHVLRNALIPVITITGVQTAWLMGGTVVVESIFALPGIGRLVMDAISYRDFPVVQGAVVMITVLVILVNLLTDLAYVAVDPRIHYA
jgi:peptide/nickel transport system permease protein